MDLRDKDTAKEKEKRTLNKRSLCVLGVSLLFYLFWFVVDGVIISVDAQSYIDGYYSREPLYPSILFVLRLLFGTSSYLYVTVLLQCILAAVATWRLTEVMAAKFHLGILSIAAIEGIQFAVVLLCRFAAGRKSTYCNSIESEGMAIPLFILFILALLQFLWNSEYKKLVGVTFYAICLICIRKQMLMVLPFLVLVYLGAGIFRKFNWRKYLIVFCSVLATTGIAQGINYLYNFALRGEFMQPTKNFAFLAVTTLYSSDSEDIESVEDENLRSLFKIIVSQIEDCEYSYKYAPAGWEQLAHHYADNYDLIQFEIAYPAIYEYVDSQKPVSTNDREKAADALTESIIKELMPKCWVNMLRVATSNMYMGLCNTVSKASTVLNWYNILFYLLYAGLIIRNIIKKKNRDINCLALVIAVAVAVNVGAVGITIFAQTRYMIYNMPLIYVSMYLLLWSYAKEKRTVQSR
ncbi:MAG: hypothetical protein J1E83_06935 [Lachnospiraceae bacterium]|nr:hypothetical protein [Lachnospiraceae bacterium]